MARPMICICVMSLLLLLLGFVSQSSEGKMVLVPYGARKGLLFPKGNIDPPESSDRTSPENYPTKHRLMQSVPSPAVGH
ncbi:PREDICTED: uncharacterized protein LOC109116623 [Tarenaya hassleriana]|uniref:uncharacterized protein LOC109116623 n=1 Tax=Tarenaya hassleriana TaxID=28532 RepID=UPI0008FCF24D|nr:PREDICTED: uncharacterized protein LOC109116623 [Tarenaya hassleriana]